MADGVYKVGRTFHKAGPRIRRLEDYPGDSRPHTSLRSEHRSLLFQVKIFLSERFTASPTEFSRSDAEEVTPPVEVTPPEAPPGPVIAVSAGRFRVPEYVRVRRSSWPCFGSMGHDPVRRWRCGVGGSGRRRSCPRVCGGAGRPGTRWPTGSCCAADSPRAR